MTEEQIEKPEEKRSEEERSQQENFDKTNSPKKNNLGILFLIFAIIIFAGGFGYGYFQLSKINLALAKNVSELQTRLSEHQNELSNLLKSVDGIQQSSQKTQDLFSQQEKIMSDWKQAQLGDTDKWKVAQAQSLTQMAQNYLQFAHNIKLALILVQQANATLENLQDPNLLELRKALTTDIANMQAIPQIDFTNLFLQLNALNNQIDKLPLPKTALQENAESSTAIAADKKLSWWKAGLDYTWQALNKIVIVRKNNGHALPLSLPEEKKLLYQNLHAQMENAIWALLHENADVYQTSLKQAEVWIKEYFVLDAAETKAMLQGLEELQKAKLDPLSYDLTNTLKQFENYFAQVKQVTKAQAQSQSGGALS